MSGNGIYFVGDSDGDLLLHPGFGTAPSNNLSYQNCTRGIYIEGGTANISSHTMDNVATGIEITNAVNQEISIEKNLINSTWRGIVSLFNSSALTFVARYNTINLNAGEAGNAAVYIADDSEVQAPENYVGRNEINVIKGENAVYMNSANGWAIIDNIINLTDAAVHGVVALGSTSSQVSCNIIEASSQATATGIRVENSTAMRYACNELSNMRVGVEFNDVCTSTDFAGNQFQNNDIGLYLNLALFNQQSHRGNRWNGSFSSHGARYDFMIPDNVSEALFFVNNLQASNLMPPNPFSGNIPWFISESGNTFECTALPECIINTNELQGGNPTEMDIFVAENNISDQVLNWIAQKALYRKVESNNAMLTNQDVATFKTNNTNQAIGELYDIAVRKNALWTLSSGDSATISTAYASTFSKMEELYLLDSLIELSSGIDSLQLANQKIIKYAELANNAGNLSTTFAEIQMERQGANQTAINENGNLVTTVHWATNDKLINDYYFQGIVDNDPTFSGLSINQLEELAKSCPLTDGDAVYRARSLYTLIAPETVYNDTLLCMPKSSLVRDDSQGIESVQYQEDVIETELSTDIQLFPNPAKDRISVNLGQPSEATIMVEFFTLQGQRIAQYQLLPGTVITELSIDELPNSVYTVRFSEKGVLINTRKVVIIK
jgi:hypothetical protein